MAISPKYNDVNKVFPDRAYQDPLAPSRETRTRSELLREYGPPTDIEAPEDQDTWDGGGEPPSTTERASLPPVETIYPIEQSTSDDRAVKRPDKRKSFWNQAANKQSTRVWGLQWIPTRISSSSADTANVMGDIIAAFARPSNSQATSVYIYPNHELKDWRTLQSSSSFGRGVKALRGGRGYTDSDSDYHKTIHPFESGLFADMLEELGAGRPGNESKTYYLAVRDAPRFKAGREGTKRAKEASKSRRRAERAERSAKNRVISGTEEIAADLRSRIGQVYNPADYE